MKKILLVIITGLFLISLVGAYSPHHQNNKWNMVVSSDDATACYLTYTQFPNNLIILSNYTMTKSGTAFNFSLPANNFTHLGDFCVGVSCTDGSTNEVGSVCRTITPSGFGETFQLYIIVLLVLAGAVILGFSIKEHWFVVLGGLGFIILGVYSLNSGIVGFRDMFMTWTISLFEIAIGTILAVGAGVQKMEMD